MEHTGKGYLNINGKVKEISVDESDIMGGIKNYHSHESAMMDGVVDNALNNAFTTEIDYKIPRNKLPTDNFINFNSSKDIDWTDSNILIFLEGVKTGRIKPKSSGHKKNKELSSFSFPNFFCEIHVHWKDDKMEVIAKSHIKDLRTQKRINAVVDTYTIAMLRHFSGLDDKQSKNTSIKGTKRDRPQPTSKTKKNIILTSENNIAMGNVQSYQIQLEQLSQLKNNLNSFSIELLNRATDYQRMLDNLYESGLPQETYNKFQAEHLEVVKSTINQMVNHIENASIPFILANIELTVQQIERNR